jgi:uncharacterized protein (TIGR03435 family)
MRAGAKISAAHSAENQITSIAVRKIAIIVIAALGGAAAQPAASPQFEVASIKPSPPAPGTGRVRVGSHGGPGTNDPGLFTCERCSVFGLIRQAFGIPDYRISGPDWLQATRFNVSAKVPEGATKQQFRMMMRNLLADRFKLKFHYEKKEMQAFDLIVAKNGPKMKESAGPLDPDERPGRLDGGRKMDEEGFVDLPPGRVPMMMLYEGHATERHAEETMEQLATNLGSQLGRPVTDATGLKGRYDFTLKWIEESAGPSTTGPDIFRALQEQLGLKLESKKGVADMLVVDHIEKAPTEN